MIICLIKQYHNLIIVLSRIARIKFYKNGSPVCDKCNDAENNVCMKKFDVIKRDGYYLAWVHVKYEKVCARENKLN